MQTVKTALSGILLCAITYGICHYKGIKDFSLGWLSCMGYYTGQDVYKYLTTK